MTFKILTFVWIGICIFCAIMLLTSCAKNPEMIWLQEQTDRCFATYGKAHYNHTEKIFECYNKPFARYPKLMFSAKYDPNVQSKLP
jgi:hypothetical protein